MALYKVTFNSADGGDVQELDDLLGNNDLCEVIAQKFKRLDSQPATPVTLEHLPWVVPVVGSGAIGGVGSWDVGLERLLRDIKDETDKFGNSPDGSEALSTIATRFVRSLVKGRRRIESPPHNAGQTRVEVTTSAARLALVTALLTRYVHAARAIDPTALNRSSDEIIELPTGIAASDDPYRIESTVHAPLLEQINHLRADLSGENKDRGLVTLLDAVKEGLTHDPRLVSMNWVRLLTEATWLKLVDRPDAYYGWSELMLNLFLESNTKGTQLRNAERGSSTIRLFARKPRMVHFGKNGEQVRKAFEEPTRTSWLADTHSSVHDALAQVLIAQARQSGKPTNATNPMTLPLPLAISTAFDLELEMALWRAGSGFQIAIPLHAHNNDDMADLVWMVGTVEPNDQPLNQEPLEAIRNPNRWMPLSAIRAKSLRNDLPTIVRATGCPLINISDDCKNTVRHLVRPKGGGAGGPYEFDHIERPGAVHVSHAVSVDEYLAIRLAEAEYQRAYESLRGNYLQLPEVADISQVFPKSGTNPTYFAFFGVPFGDPAVRQRLMSLLTVRWIRRTGLTKEEDPRQAGQKITFTNSPKVVTEAELSVEAENLRRGLAGPRSLSGIAVNTRLDLEEASLLSWLGLSVTHGDCAKLVPHLLDYAAHVCDESDNWHPVRSSTCTVRNP
jgi:hypothetical protein